jgi:hypothetical protein
MSKYYVCFENKGEVPVNAFKLLGASNKRADSSKIGYFGTGLKYAIAVMLKQGIEFKIFSGNKEVVIGTRKTKFLEDTVDVMTVNGEKTSITLDAGIDWKPWYAIREIYSNAIDEGGTMSLNQLPEPKANHTRIFIDSEAEALQDIFKNWNAYFTQSRDAVFRNTRGTLFTKLPTVPEYIAFRKGIRVFESRKHSVFDYDLPDVEINESRVAIYSFKVNESCSELLASSNIECVQEYLKLSKNSRRSEYIEWEDGFWDYTAMYSFSDAWIEALNDYRLVPANFAGHYDITETTLILPDKLIDKLQNRFGEAINVAGNNKDKFTIIDGVNKQPLQKLLDVYSVAGFEWELDKIDIVKFNDKDIYGQAKDGRVLLSNSLFTPTRKHEVASVLLEEITHAITGYADCTREMQGYLFKTITNMAKDLAGSVEGSNK